jgi:hypothetical protein
VLLGDNSSAAAPTNNFVLISHVSAGSPDGNNVSTSGSVIDTTGANLLILVVADYEAGSSPTPADNKANTWTSLTAAVKTGSSRAHIFYSKPTSVGTSHFFEDTTAGGSYCSIAVAAFSGSTATPFDVEAGGNGTSSTASAGSGITPSQNGELIIAGVSIGAGSVSSIDSGFTSIESQSYGASTHFGIALAYKLQTSAAAVDPNWSLSGSADWAAVLASFKGV